MSARGLPDLARCCSALIVKPSSLGDIVHTLPAVRCLKRAHPHLHLRWLCNSEWTPLLEGNGDLDEVIAFPRSSFRGAGMVGVVPWAWRLNHADRELPEVALDFQGLLRSALLGTARGANPVIGLSDAREGASFFYHQTIGVDASAHAVDRYLAMAHALGAETDEVEFPLPQGSEPQLENPLPQNFTLVHPYSRGTGKSLDGTTLQALCDGLGPRPVVLVGRTRDETKITGAHIVSLLNRTSLGELLWLLRRASFIVSVDSGPMHLAAALQPERTLGIHTWSDPRRVGPYDARAWLWKAGRIAHRGDFSSEEATAHVPFTVDDARSVANLVLQSPA
jgi:ADP-heptose:LPS heptosyltransferase